MKKNPNLFNTVKIIHKCVKVGGLHLCLPNCVLQSVLETSSEILTLLILVAEDIKLCTN